MKRIVIITTLIALATLPAMPQQHVRQAIATLEREASAYATGCIIQLDTHPVTGESETVEHITIYRVPRDHRALLERVRASFDSDTAVAYYHVNAGAGRPHRATSLTAGFKNEQTLLGTDFDRNYRVLCFTDSRDGCADYRYAYALEWADRDDYTDCRVIMTYGGKPSAASTALSWNSDWMKDLSQLSQLSQLKQLKQLENIFGDDDDDDDDDADVAWLTAFNHYRTAFMQSDTSPATQSAYAARILKLCKQAAAQHILDDDLRALCTTGIDEMRHHTTDTFIAGLLTQAINCLK